ncbi:MAG: metal ABC transporter solute-binding protein, Zn/Mn family [Thermoplasmata archaeon]
MLVPVSSTAFEGKHLPNERIEKVYQKLYYTLLIYRSLVKSMNKKQKFFLLVVIVSVIILIGATAWFASVRESTEKLQVVATFYPLYFFASEVGKDKAEVSMLIPDNSEVHSWEPGIPDILKVEKAKIFIYNGAGLEPWVPDVISAVKNRPLIVDASKDISLALSPAIQEILDTAKNLMETQNYTTVNTSQNPTLYPTETQYYQIILGQNSTEYAGTLKIENTQGGEFFIGADTNIPFDLRVNGTLLVPKITVNGTQIEAYPPLKMAQIFSLNSSAIASMNIMATSPCINLTIFQIKEMEHESEMHEHALYDPHIWVDPILAKIQVDNILKAFIDTDPQNSDYYIQNAKILKQKLDKLHADFLSGLRNKTKSDIVCTHLAFNYLGKRYGFNVHAAVGITADKEPSPADLANLSALIRALGLRYVYVEPGFSDRYMQTLANETGAQILILDAVHGRTGVHANMDYFQIMYENLKNLRIGLEVNP